MELGSEWLPFGVIKHGDRWVIPELAMELSTRWCPQDSVQLVYNSNNYGLW